MGGAGVLAVPNVHVRAVDEDVPRSVDLMNGSYTIRGDIWALQYKLIMSTTSLKTLTGCLILLLVACGPARKQSAQSSAGYTILFYNVENLFDTVDDPATQDDDFTPGGKLEWTGERLSKKIGRIGEVMTRSDVSFPVLAGLCEVENAHVLDMLISSEALRPAAYGVLHRDSPDERGIDVALLYRRDAFVPEQQEWLRVELPQPADPYTRDILYVSGLLGGERIHVFVNHWPSRSGGQQESEPNRIHAAHVLAGRIAAIRNQDTGARIICMGDFNDHPSDTSVRKVLGAGSASEDFLFNMMADDEQRGEGSHWYKGEWGPLDQFIVSRPLLDARRGLRTTPEGARTMQDSFLLFTDSKGQVRPSRTYAGEKYVDGYSDHLPIVLQLSR